MDKEKQIEICENCKIKENCSHRILVNMEKCKVNDCDYFQNISTDKEMIEEMAKDIDWAKERIWNSVNLKKDDYSWHSKGIATHLVNLDYRKLPKDARVFIPTDEQYVLLSKEEYEDLQVGKDFDYGYHEGYKNTEAYYENFKLPEERKETATTIINWFLSKGCFTTEELVDFAKQFGCEIEIKE